jgi:hypothetical protein
MRGSRPAEAEIAARKAELAAEAQRVGLNLSGPASEAERPTWLAKYKLFLENCAKAEQQKMKDSFGPRRAPPER